MDVIDLTDEHLQLYLVCLEDWSEEMREAGDRKALWYDRMRDSGLRVKLALDESGRVGGMIQYVPAALSFLEGDGFYFMQCIWVHGYRKGRGNFQKKGMGRALIEAAEDDARSLGAKGFAAWGLALPFWMKASWFKKQGYKKVDRMGGLQVLLWKPFTRDAVPPKWIRRKKKPEKTPGKVTVTSFINGWCPAQNIVHERAKRASAESGENVLFREVNTSDRETFLEWGIADALYIDDTRMWTGPPPSYDRIKRAIEKKLKKLK